MEPARWAGCWRVVSPIHWSHRSILSSAVARYSIFGRPDLTTNDRSIQGYTRAFSTAGRQSIGRREREGSLKGGFRQPSGTHFKVPASTGFTSFLKSSTLTLLVKRLLTSTVPHFTLQRLRRPR